MKWIALPLEAMALAKPRGSVRAPFVSSGRRLSVGPIGPADTDRACWLPTSLSDTWAVGPPSAAPVIAPGTPMPLPNQHSLKESLLPWSWRTVVVHAGCVHDCLLAMSDSDWLSPYQILRNREELRFDHGDETVEDTQDLVFGLMLPSC